MEFWGVEVKSGEPFVVEQEEETILHLSQACLGEVKKDKGSEPVYLFAKVDDKKFVIGILSSEKFPQISFDLVFEKDFELSHNWKNGSVHFTGYKSFAPHGEDEDDESDSEDEMAPVPFEHGGSSLQAKPEEKSEDVKKDVKPDQKATAKKEEDSDEDDFETDEDESEDDESEEEEDKVEISKKRPAETAKKTSGDDKRAKFQTPEKAVAKTGGNKVGGHTATPHPAKQAGKTAAKNDQPKQQTPKSGGAFPCKSCNRSFGSDIALQSHTKAKHATSK